jgi:3-methyl-2-oxobutanoate hydroxymethyltransferase
MTTLASMKMTVQDVINRKQVDRQKITALTAYDFPTARLVDQAGIDIALVGDSLGMVCLGYESTVSVTMEEMIHHTKAARRGVKRALLVVDMPFNSYCDAKTAVQNAKRLQAAGAEAVKLEGGLAMSEQVKALRNAKIEVMGHLGMTPQSIEQLGGYKVQGKAAKDADQIFEDARTLEKLGVFSMVLECVPASLAKRVSTAIQIPTIGIGAGLDADGQVLVFYDLLGIQSSVRPKFVRQYAKLEDEIARAVNEFKKDVIARKFPTEKESFK